MLIIRRLVFYACAMLLTPNMATARPDRNFQRGLELMKDLEYDQAIQSMHEALANPSHTPADRALIFLYLGIIQSSQMDQTAAVRRFEQALAEDRTIRPPANISPKITDLFEEVLARHPVTPLAQPTTQPQAPPPPPPPRLDADQGAPSTNWPAWITLGTGLAAGGAGIALGVLSQSARDRAEDKAVPYEQAKEQLNTANSRALAANILLITAGTAAAAAGVLFYLGWTPREKVSATLTPTPVGMMLQLEWLR